MFFLSNVRVGQTTRSVHDEFQILVVDFLQNVHVILQNDKDVQWSWWRLEKRTITERRETRNSFFKFCHGPSSTMIYLISFRKKGASHQPLLDTITIEHDLDSLLFWSIAIISWVSRVNHHCLRSHLGRSIVQVFGNASVWNGLDVWTRCANGREDIRTFPMEWFWERLSGGGVVSRDRTSSAILIASFQT